MKLYTEEQVENIIALCYLRQFKNIPINVEDVQKQFTPIELPSDEDIENIMISKYPHSVGVGVGHLIKSDERIGFEEGAKWMKEQILNQNK